MLFRINAQSEVYEQALADASACRTCCAAASGSSTGPRSARRRLLLRGAARAGEDADEPLPDAVRGGARRAWAGTPTTRRRAARPASAGSPWPRWSPWPTTCVAVAPEAAPGRVHRRAGAAGRRPARPDRAGRHAGLAALGQGPGVGRGVPGRAHRHHAADPARHHAGAGRRGAPAALRRHHPGPRAARAVLGAGPQPRAAPRPPAEPVPRRPAPGDAARGRGAPKRSAAPRPRPRTPSCSAGCGPGASRRPRRRGCRRTWCSPTPRWSRSPTRTRRAAAGAGPDLRGRADQARPLRRAGARGARRRRPRRRRAGRVELRPRARAGSRVRRTSASAPARRAIDDGREHRSARSAAASEAHAVADRPRTASDRRVRDARCRCRAVAAAGLEHVQDRSSCRRRRRRRSGEQLVRQALVRCAFTIAPSTATPTTAPSWRAVFVAEAAIPECAAGRGRARPTVSGTTVMPNPSPARASATASAPKAGVAASSSTRASSMPDGAERAADDHRHRGTRPAPPSGRPRAPPTTIAAAIGANIPASCQPE